MNVTQLRQRLEELERAGNGDCRVEVSPTPPPPQVINSGDLSDLGIDFAAEDYGVTDVDIRPWQRGLAVTLLFTEMPESLAVLPGDWTP